MVKNNHKNIIIGKVNFTIQKTFCKNDKIYLQLYDKKNDKKKVVYITSFKEHFDDKKTPSFSKVISFISKYIFRNIKR
jgi:uncharacterized HAD superfamily protein